MLSDKNYLDSAIPEVEKTPETVGVEKTSRNAKKRLIQLTTGMALATSVLGTDPSFAQERQPQFKKIASVGETMIVAERIISTEDFFNDTKLAEYKRAMFRQFESKKQNEILKYYCQALEDSPNMGEKDKKRLGASLVGYYDSLMNTKEYIAELQKMNGEYNYKGGLSLEAEGKNIERYLPRYGTRFSEPGKRLDDQFEKVTNDYIKMNDEKIKELKEHIKELKEIIEIFDKLSASI